MRTKVHNIESQNIDLVVEGGHMTAYEAKPTTNGSYPGVILGFELFGITAYIRRTADMIASWGYTVVVPDFYHRWAPAIELLADDEGRKVGFELLNKLSRQQAMADVSSVISHLRTAGCSTIGMVGLSVGGHIAYVAAAKLDLEAVAVCYAGWLPTPSFPISQPEPSIELTPQIAEHDSFVLFIVGEEDGLIPAEQRTQIRQTLEAAHVRHEFIVYPETAHGFLCEERPSYHERSANDAWARIQSMLDRELDVSQRPQLLLTP